MFPWLWFWAPQIQFPLSGPVVQDFEPGNAWFFKAIKPEAGNADIEKQAFDIATYGKQLGLISEVLIELAQAQLPKNAASGPALEALKAIQKDIKLLIQNQTDQQIRTLRLELQQAEQRALGLSRSNQTVL